MVLSLSSLAHSAADPEFTFTGGASLSLGYVGNSSDTSTYNYNGNRMQTVGALASDDTLTFGQRQIKGLFQQMALRQ